MKRITLFIATALLWGCIFAAGVVMAECDDQEPEQDDEYILIYTVIV
jgi:hypothetical protein